MVVGSTGDPVTPYAWAQALASQLAHGVLLTRIGDGHTAFGASTCIRTRVTSYFVGLAVPPRSLGGLDITFPETYSPTDHQGNYRLGVAVVKDGIWGVHRVIEKP